MEDLLSKKDIIFELSPSYLQKQIDILECIDRAIIDNLGNNLEKKL